MRNFKTLIQTAIHTLLTQNEGNETVTLENSLNKNKQTHALGKVIEETQNNTNNGIKIIYIKKTLCEISQDVFPINSLETFGKLHKSIILC